MQDFPRIISNSNEKRQTKKHRFLMAQHSDTKVCGISWWGLGGKVRCWRKTLDCLHRFPPEVPLPYGSGYRNTLKASTVHPKAYPTVQARATVFSLPPNARIFLFLAPFVTKIYVWTPRNFICKFGPDARRHRLWRRGNTARRHSLWRRAVT
jgi:hypothetical protein